MTMTVRESLPAPSVAQLSCLGHRARLGFVEPEIDSAELLADVVGSETVCRHTLCAPHRKASTMSRDYALLTRALATSAIIAVASSMAPAAGAAAVAATSPSSIKIKAPEVATPDKAMKFRVTVTQPNGDAPEGLVKVKVNGASYPTGSLRQGKVVYTIIPAEGANRVKVRYLGSETVAPSKTSFVVQGRN